MQLYLYVPHSITLMSSALYHTVYWYVPWDSDN